MKINIKLIRITEGSEDTSNRRVFWAFIILGAEKQEGDKYEQNSTDID